MTADTNFVSALLRERHDDRPGPARAFLALHRGATIRTTIITAGELAAWFDQSIQVWVFLRRWRVYRLHDGIVSAAADIDRALIEVGARLGENDNWIAGFCQYYREPIISRDRDFDRVRGLRRLEW